MSKQRQAQLGKKIAMILAAILLVIGCSGEVKRRKAEVAEDKTDYKVTVVNETMRNVYIRLNVWAYGGGYDEARWASRPMGRPVLLVPGALKTFRTAMLGCPTGVSGRVEKGATIGQNGGIMEVYCFEGGSVKAPHANVCIRKVCGDQLIRVTRKQQSHIHGDNDYDYGFTR